MGSSQQVGLDDSPVHHFRWVLWTSWTTSPAKCCHWERLRASVPWTTDWRDMEGSIILIQSRSQRLGSRRYDTNGWFFLSVWYRNVPKTWQLQCFPVLLEIIPSFMWDSPTAIDIHKPYHDWGWLISTIYRTHKHMMIVVMTWGLSNWLQTWVYHGLPHAFPCYTAHKHMVMTWGWLISAPPTIRPRWVCQRVAGECRSDPNPCVQWPKHHLWMSGWEHMGKHGNLWDFTMNYRVFSYV